MAGRQALNRAELELVGRVPLFDGLTAETVASLVVDARAVSYEARTLVLSSGDRADRFFVVLAGKVRLSVLTVQGRESVIEVIEPGQSFAEAAMFGSGRVPVNAEAEPGTRLVHIPAKLILARIAEDAAVARRMMDSLARWQRHLIDRVGGLKVRTPGQRLASALLALATAVEAGAETGAVTVRLPDTKAALAAQIGITPESLSRAMARLRQVGVSSRGRDVVIADLGLLRRYCEERGGSATPADAVELISVDAVLPASC
jgi:CRP-like cAMP-binding protein